MSILFTDTLSIPPVQAADPAPNFINPAQDRQQPFAGPDGGGGSTGGCSASRCARSPMTRICSATSA